MTQEEVRYNFEKRYGMSTKPVAFPDPTPEIMADPRFNVIWNAIKAWDINTPGVYGGYCGALGNHVRVIIDALDGAHK